MKFRNELILAICFVIGSVVSSMPNGVTDYAEQASLQSLTPTIAQVTPLTGR